MGTRPMRRWLAALSVALAVPSAGHAIIGGSEDTSGLFPGVASLTSPTTSASAVLISPDWALTAAHVVCDGAGCAVPEPGTWATLAAGLAVLLVLRAGRRAP